MQKITVKALLSWEEDKYLPNNFPVYSGSKVIYLTENNTRIEGTLIIGDESVITPAKENEVLISFVPSAEHGDIIAVGKRLRLQFMESFYCSAEIISIFNVKQTKKFATRKLNLNFLVSNAWEQKTDIAIFGHRSPILKKVRKETNTHFNKLNWGLYVKGVDDKLPDFFHPREPRIFGSKSCSCEIISCNEDSIPWLQVVKFQYNSRVFVNRQSVGRLSGILNGTNTLFKPRSVLFTPLSWRNPYEDAVTLLAAIYHFHSADVASGVQGRPNRNVQYFICDKQDLSPFKKIADKNFEPVKDWLRFSMGKWQREENEPIEIRDLDISIEGDL